MNPTRDAHSGHKSKRGPFWSSYCPVPASTRVYPQQRAQPHAGRSVRSNQQAALAAPLTGQPYVHYPKFHMYLRDGNGPVLRQTITSKQMPAGTPYQLAQSACLSIFGQRRLSQLPSIAVSALPVMPVIPGGAAM